MSAPADRLRQNAPMLALACGLAAALVVGGVVLLPDALRGPRQAEARHTAGAASSTGVPAASGPSIAAALEKSANFQRAGQFNEVVKLLRPLADAEGPAAEDQGVRVALAQAYFGLNQPKDAYEQYQAAIAIAGADARPASDGAGGVTRNPAGAALHFEAGTAATQAGLSERAVEHYATAQTLDPADARFPLFLGMVQARTGNDAEAVASLLRAAKLKPDAPEAWGTLAEIELRRNNARLALQHIEKARTLQPEAGRWRVVEARALNRTGDADKALALLTSLDAATRAQTPVLALTAESYGLLRRPADAAAMYAQAAAAQPGDAEIAYQAALWAQRAGDADASQRFAKQAAGLGHAGAKALVEGR